MESSDNNKRNNISKWYLKRANPAVCPSLAALCEYIHIECALVSVNEYIHMFLIMRLLFLPSCLGDVWGHYSVGD